MSRERTTALILGHILGGVFAIASLAVGPFDIVPGNWRGLTIFPVIAWIGAGALAGARVTDMLCGPRK